MVGARYHGMPPFKACTAAALDRLRLTAQGSGFMIELLLRAHAERLRVVDVPVSCRTRAGGALKVSGTLRGRGPREPEDRDLDRRTRLLVARVARVTEGDWRRNTHV